MRAIPILIAFVLVAVVIPPSAMGDELTVAQLKALKFTVIITDGQDHGDFLDIRELAYAEPGDGTLVVRFTVGGWATAPPTATIDHFFTPGKNPQLRWGIGSSGASSSGWAKCLRDGTSVVAYCWASYESMKVNVGDKITGTSAISYAGSAQDYAPGTAGLVEIAKGAAGMGSYGKDYVLTGGAGAAPAVALPEVFALNASNDVVATAPGGNASFAITIANNGNSSANFSVDATGAPATFESSFDPANGTVAGHGLANTTLTIHVPNDGAPGKYNLTVHVQGPLGGNASKNLTLTVAAPASPSPTGTGAGTSAGSVAANATGTVPAGTKAGGVPGPQLWLVMGSLCAAVAVFRRRRGP